MRFLRLCHTALPLSIIPFTAPLVAQDAPLPAGVARIIERAPLDRAHWGIAVLDAATGRSLVAHNAHRLFIPASNVKLVVAAAAAHHPDPSFRYVTSVESTARISGRRVVFAVIANNSGSPSSAMRPVLDDIVRAIAAAF